tara:strand:+ start:499 stop:738 length:240 start_codon:yes stop_codon:yes gene_type:complete
MWDLDGDGQLSQQEFRDGIAAQGGVVAALSPLLAQAQGKPRDWTEAAAGGDEKQAVGAAAAPQAKPPSTGGIFGKRLLF